MLCGRMRSRCRRRSKSLWHTRQCEDLVARRTKSKAEGEGAPILEEQRASAEALQAQIDELVSGKAPRRKPKNLRDFVDQAMADEGERK